MKAWDAKDQRCVQTLQLRFPNLMAGRHVEQGAYSLTLQTKPFRALTIVCGDYFALLKLGAKTTHMQLSGVGAEVGVGVGGRS